MPARLAILTSFLLLCAGVTAAGSPRAINLTVKNPICLAPCILSVSITIDAKQVPSGQVICIAVYDDFPYPHRVGCWRHYGERVTNAQIKDIPQGVYEVMVSSGKHRDTATLEVH